MILAKALAFELQKMPAWAKNVLIVSASSILIALFAKIAIPLPFSPVPIIMQDSVVLLLAVLLGPKRAVAAVGAFLMQGALGFPVFAKGSGLLYFFGPTGGYLIGYLVAALIVSTLIERMKSRTISSAVCALLLGNVAVFFFGATWLSSFVGMRQAIVLGVVPFLLGNAIKTAMSAQILYWLGWGKR